MRFVFGSVALMALTACSVEVPDFRGGTDTAAADAPAATPAQPVSAKERFVAAAEANGCGLNADNVTTVMEQAQLTSADLENIMLALVSEGRAAPDGAAAFRLTTPNCAA